MKANLLTGKMSSLLRNRRRRNNVTPAISVHRRDIFVERFGGGTLLTVHAVVSRHIAAARSTYDTHPM